MHKSCCAGHIANRDQGHLGLRLGVLAAELAWCVACNSFGADRMARWCWLLSAALAASAISSVATAQADGPVSIEDIPAPARDAILRHVGSGFLMEVVEETSQGEPVYEGRINHAGGELTVVVDAAGNTLEIYRPV
jgi:hypothetical protein